MPAPRYPFSRDDARNLARRPRWQRALVISAAAVAGLAAPARTPLHAQVRFTPASAPTRGLEIPVGPIVGEAEATALELNPGQLGLVQGATLNVLVNRQPAGTLRQNPGLGFFGVVPAGGFALAGALQSLVWPGGRAYTKSQLGLGLGNGDTFGVGLTWNHFFADRVSYLEDLDTFDAGLSLRPWRYLGLGVVARDLNRARLGSGRALQRAYTAEVAYRPWGDDTLELAAGVTLGEDRASPGGHGRLHWRAHRGLHVLGQVSAATADVFPNTVVDRRATLGVAVDFEHAGMSLFGLGSRSPEQSELAANAPGSRERSLGMSVGLRLSSSRREPLIAPRVIERVELAGIEGDRAFVTLLTRLQRLEHAPGVAGVLFELDDLKLGLGRIEELRAVIARLRASGKRTYAFFTNAGTRAYFLASACERILMQTAGTLMLDGLSSTVTFWKGALDRAGVGVDVVRIAEYKGAMEPFMFSELSEPVRQNADALLEHAYQRIVGSIESDRPALRGRLTEVIATGMHAAEGAREAMLVDAITDRAVLDTLEDLPVEDGSAAPRHRRSWAAPRVALLLVDGPIVDGESTRVPLAGMESTGAATVLERLERARADDDVRALVLRVNSPGGSVTASQEIARALERVRAAGKPVIVSMGDVAASGGYYVSARGDRVYAQALSVTGSIGIYSAHLDIQGLAASLGVDFETLKRGPHADRMGVHRPWDDEERAQLEAHLRALYRLFVETVADGRKDRGLDVAGVEALGGGRVFHGAEARERKLVDEEGGLLAAIAEAARRAHVPLDAAGLPELEIYDNVKGPLFAIDVTPTAVRVSVGRGGEDEASAPPRALEEPGGLTTLARRIAVRAGLPRVLPPWLVALLHAPEHGALAVMPFHLDPR